MKSQQQLVHEMQQRGIRIDGPVDELTVNGMSAHYIYNGEKYTGIDSSKSAARERAAERLVPVAVQPTLRPPPTHHNIKVQLEIRSTYVDIDLEFLNTETGYKARLVKRASHEEVCKIVNDFTERFKRGDSNLVVD